MVFCRIRCNGFLNSVFDRDVWMFIFEEYQIRAYIMDLSKKFDLGVLMPKGQIKLDDNCFSFRGRLSRDRNDKSFVFVINNIELGVFDVQSILIGPDTAKMSWLVGGQPSKNCRLLKGFDSGESGSLHASKNQIREYTFLNLSKQPDDRKAAAQIHFEEEYDRLVDTGLYADDVSVGEYISDDTGDRKYLELSTLDVSKGVVSIFVDTPSIGNLPTIC